MMLADRDRSFLPTVVRCTTRLICLGTLAWSGLIVADTAGSIKSRLRISDVAADETTTAIEVPDQLMPAGGYWSFADSDLAIRRIRCSEEDLQLQMKSMLAIADSPMTSKHDAIHLIALAKSNGATRNDCPAGSVWTFDNGALQLRLVTSNTDRPGLIAAAVATRDGDRWQLTILQPQRRTSDHLLALPADAGTFCTRRSDAGRLQMELISTSHSNNQLLDIWRLDGWDVRRTPWGSADSFSYLCVRGDQVVYAWSELDTASRTIMLTSTTLE